MQEVYLTGWPLEPQDHWFEILARHTKKWRRIKEMAPMSGAISCLSEGVGRYSDSFSNSRNSWDFHHTHSLDEHSAPQKCLNQNSAHSIDATFKITRRTSRHLTGSQTDHGVRHGDRRISRFKVRGFK